MKMCRLEMPLPDVCHDCIGIDSYVEDRFSEFACIFLDRKDVGKYLDSRPDFCPLIVEDDGDG
jgi:hypothetical protein